MTSAVSAAVATWVILVTMVLLLATLRFAMTRGKYTVLHVRRSEMSRIADQVRDDQRLTRIDFWGQLLTTVALALGLLLTGLYVYVSYTEAASQVLR